MSTPAKAFGIMNLQELAEHHQCDKVFNHTYLPLYEEQLERFRDKEFTLLEIGVWKGGSIKTWLDWFPKATIIGIDLHIPKLDLPGNQANRVQLYSCSQDDEDRLRELFPPECLDVVIDDGSHLLKHQILTTAYLWESLKPNGLYYIEDIQEPEKLDLFSVFPNFKYWDNRKKLDRYDDVLVRFEKPERGSLCLVGFQGGKHDS